MSIADIVARLFGGRRDDVDPNEDSLPEDDPRAWAGSEIRSVMIYLKDDRIYVFTMAFVGYRVHTLDGCRAQHAGDVRASDLGRDALILMQASGRTMSKREHRRRDDPLASVFGRRITSRFCKGMGLVSVTQPKPTEDIHIGPQQFQRTTPFPAGDPTIISRDADAEQVGRAILEKLRESLQMNA